MSTINKPTVEGRGLLNNLINGLPFELHIPGYQYCGPGTKLDKRLSRGDPGINPLDVACKKHDIAYKNNLNLKQRHLADRILIQKAQERLKSSQTSLGERAAALSVSSLITAKEKLLKKKEKKSKNSFSKVWRFLLPLIAGLSTAVSAGARAIKTIKDLSNAKKLIQETERHNKAIEEISKKGKGLFLRPYKKSGKGIKKRRKKQKTSKKNYFL